MQYASPFTVITVVLPIALIVVGIAFLKIGFWPRRRGDTPYCKGCGYRLVGNQSGVCPECGRAFTDTTLVRGERHRHKGITITGLVMLLLGGFIGSGFWVEGINWYQYMPQQLVVSDAASSDPKVAERAWIELLRRRAIAPLSEDVEKKLTDIALKHQASPSPGPLVDPMLEFVAQRFLDKKLTAQQADQFFLNTVNPSLHTRETVAAGDVIPVQITYSGRGPSRGWSYRLSTKDVKVGSQIIMMGGSIGGSGLGGSGSSTTYATGQKPGEYPLEAHIRVEIFHTALGGVAPPVWSKDLALKSTLKVLARDVSEMVKLTDRPELAEQIKKSLRIDQFIKHPDGSVDIQVQIEKPPMNVAFSVFVRINGKEFRIGDLAADTNANMGTSMDSSKIGDIALGKTALIFRSDPAVARKTIDLVEIWKGEIVLEAELKEQGK